jgi:ABC-type oligopeptide transport system substrate-binding subunit
MFDKFKRMLISVFVLSVTAIVISACSKNKLNDTNVPRSTDVPEYKTITPEEVHKGTSINCIF